MEEARSRRRAGSDNHAHAYRHIEARLLAAAMGAGVVAQARDLPDEAFEVSDAPPPRCRRKIPPDLRMV